MANTSKAKEKSDYSYIMLCGWSGLACVQKNEFAVNWCEDIKTVTIPYLEYKDELYFLYDGQHAEGVLGGYHILQKKHCQ